MKHIPFLLIHLLIFFVFLTSISSAQSEGFEPAVFPVIQAFQSQGSTRLNAMTHPETGLVIVYAPGIRPSLFDIYQVPQLP